MNKIIATTLAIALSATTAMAFPSTSWEVNRSESVMDAGEKSISIYKEGNSVRGTPLVMLARCLDNTTDVFFGEASTLSFMPFWDHNKPQLRVKFGDGAAEGLSSSSSTDSKVLFVGSAIPFLKKAVLADQIAVEIKTNQEVYVTTFNTSDIDKLAVEISETCNWSLPTEGLTIPDENGCYKVNEGTPTEFLTCRKEEE